MVSVNCLMSQNPKIAITFYPGIMGLTSPVASMLDAMIFDPASPNPRAKSAPILMSVFSRICVSNGDSFFFFFLFPFESFRFPFSSSG